MNILFLYLLKKNYLYFFFYLWFNNTIFNALKNIKRVKRTKKTYFTYRSNNSKILKDIIESTTVDNKLIKDKNDIENTNDNDKNGQQTK